MRFFRRPWDDDRGDEFASWGTSVFYLAVDASGEVRRQVEVYASGVVLDYDEQHDEDRYGGLTYAELDLEEFAPFEITEREFLEDLAELVPVNR
ncbi:hypothetical protein [Nonomuraea basaltis]|uniref:hypothetical protein n=1 Tax=Nonomuraea basaltis TaxID=2495887 RepID=UPI001981560F|nr:hypothetical protein [Nonomuraea basaltis]